MIKLLLCNYILLLIVFSWIRFLRLHQHILITLLSLEFIGVVTYFNLYLNLNIIERELYFILVYLTFLVCEGALGLRLLVVQIRGIGTDYLKVIRITKW